MHSMVRAENTESGLEYQFALSSRPLAMESHGKHVDDRQNVVPVVLGLPKNGANGT